MRPLLLLVLALCASACMKTREEYQEAITDVHEAQKQEEARESPTPKAPEDSERREPRK